MTPTATSPLPSGGGRVGKPVLSLESVSLTYPGPIPVPALRSCTFMLWRGDYVAVVGPSGSGKSTLLNILGLLDVPTSGRYLLDDIDPWVMSDPDRAALRARRIGFVFQSFHLVPYLDAVDNAALGLLYHGVARRHRRSAARDALARVGLSHRAHAVPGELSGGERQRVALARALVSEPDLLLCDEPTGNLDTETSEEVLRLVESIRAAGPVVVMITHDPLVASRAARILTVRDGIVSETQQA